MPIKPAIVCLTEHWIRHDNMFLLHKIDGYKLVSNYSRQNKCRGGACVLVAETLTCQAEPIFNKHSIELYFECCGIKISKPYKIILFCIYRSTFYSKCAFNIFFNRLTNVLDLCCKKYPKHKLIIAGDFNIDILKESPPRFKFVDILGRYNICLHINDPTRLTCGSNTCIDNIASNFKPDYCSCTIVGGYLSDHTAQLMTVSLTQQQIYRDNNKSKTLINSSKRIQIFSKLNINTFYDNLSKESWNSLYVLEDKISDCNILYQKFLSIFFMYFEQCFLERNKKINSDSHVQVKRWVTQGIRISCEKAKYLHALCRSSASFELKRFYKTYKKILNRCIRAAKIRFNSDNIRKSDNKIRMAWNIVKKETNIPARDQDLLKVFPHKTPENVLNTFNDFFVNISKTLNLKPNLEGSLEFCKGLPVTRSRLISFSPVTRDEIIEIMQRLNFSKTPGWDEIPPFLIKSCRNLLADPLLFIINLSFKRGEFPDLLKFSNIIPIFKKDNPTDLNSYRPIAILPAFSKVFEKAVVNRLTSYFEDNELLNKNQYGFQKNKNTIGAIYELVLGVASSFERGHKTAGAFCDLSKAFDCVDHRILIEKIKFYGIDGTALKWLTSFLSNRHQRVQNHCSGTFSNFLQSSNGVPQGSILGPFLFLIYINDLRLINPDSRIITYADDTTVLTSGAHVDGLTAKLNANLRYISDWFVANGLSLNSNKSHLINFHCSRLTDSLPPNSTNNMNMNLSSTTNFLGVALDDALSWREHIKKLSVTLNKAYYVLLTLKHALDRESLIMVYYAYVYSHISYGIIFWGNSVDSHRIFKLQKRIIRIICGIRQRDTCRPHFKQLKILSMPSIYIFQLLVFVKNNLNRFRFTTDNHTYNTRNSNTIAFPIHRTTAYEKTPFYSGMRYYNKLPDNIRKTESVSAFKKKVKDLLVNGNYYSTNEFLDE
jgi:hypothetical protein